MHFEYEYYLTSRHALQSLRKRSESDRILTLNFEKALWPRFILCAAIFLFKVMVNSYPLFSSLWRHITQASLSMPQRWRFTTKPRIGVRTSLLATPRGCISNHRPTLKERITSTLPGSGVSDFFCDVYPNKSKVFARLWEWEHYLEGVKSGKQLVFRRIQQLVCSRKIDISSWKHLKVLCAQLM